MSDPVPHLQPIADAFRAAAAAQEAEAAGRAEADEAAAQAEQERVEDTASIKRAFRKGRLKGALAVGRALGWSKAEVEALFREPERPADGGPAPGEGGDRPPPPPRGGAGGPGWKPKRDPIKRLPDDCPVQPLGTSDGAFYYLNPLGQLRALTKHGPDDIRGLFGARQDFLWTFWPKYRADGSQSTWEAAFMAESLIDAASRRGAFDPAERLRGVGAWRGDDGELILHCGDGVFFGGEWRPPGYHGDHVYPGAEPLPRPASEPADGRAARELLALYDSWSYVDEEDGEAGGGVEIGPGLAPSASALALLGWQAAALVGGALDWRPALVVTGDAGTGKSTLQRVVGRVMGASLVQSSDATAAGVYQSVGFSSRAVGIDEAENEPNSTKMRNMVDLLRQAASGGKILRGSSDHKFRGFTARSAFLLSAIILPPFQTQDLTRITKLELGPLPAGGAPPDADAGRLGALGRALRRRILDGWGRWPATLERYRAELAGLGHDARGCDQYGTLLAMADLCLWDGEPDGDTVRALAGPFARDRVLGRQERPSNAESFLDRLITTPIEAFRGGNRLTVGQLVAGGAGLIETPQGTPESYRDAARAWGIYVDGLMGAVRVTLPNIHTGLGQLLDRTPWSSSGATSGWSQAMRRLPGAKATNSRAIGGRGWSVPVRVFLRQDDEGGAAC